MKQTYIDKNVYAAAMERMTYIFKEFDNIYISFSGGKDSGVMLNLALEYRRVHCPDRKIGIFHIDYEAQYSMTTEYVDRVYSQLDVNIENLRCCIPLKCPTSTSMSQSHWRPWDPELKHLWVRDLPENCIQNVDFVTTDTSDYEFQKRFSLYHHQTKKANKTCILVGIRAQESLDRWRTIVSDRNINKYSNNGESIAWSTKMYDDVYNVYPIYDWTTEDIWTANAKFGWDYNTLYDLMYYAGVPISQQRVASPFHNSAKSSLQLYRVIDPNVWGKMVSRVNGVNFTALYGDTKVMGWKNISKPDHFSWQEYGNFLLDTLPKEIADNYRIKLATSIKFWKDKGGTLEPETIQELIDLGIDITLNESAWSKKQAVRMDYIDSFDGKDFKLVPSWKRLCVCILKNDHVGKYMGFSANKIESSLRKNALEKYKDL